MYDKIADYVNDKLEYTSCVIEARDVEEYLRYGESDFVSEDEGFEIEAALEKFL